MFRVCYGIVPASAVGGSNRSRTSRVNLGNAFFFSPGAFRLGKDQPVRVYPCPCSFGPGSGNLYLGSVGTVSGGTLRGRGKQRRKSKVVNIGQISYLETHLTSSALEFPRLVFIFLFHLETSIVFYFYFLTYTPYWHFLILTLHTATSPCYITSALFCHTA